MVTEPEMTEWQIAWPAPPAGPPSVVYTTTDEAEARHLFVQLRQSRRLGLALQRRRVARWETVEVPDGD